MGQRPPWTGRDGIVCFVSNNGFFGTCYAFDGYPPGTYVTRTSRASTILDLQRERACQPVENAVGRKADNVFMDQIRVGVGITVAVR